MHADPAEHLAGLPAPVPDGLPGPARPRPRARRGRTTASAPACTTHWPAGGGCGARSAPCRPRVTCWTAAGSRRVTPAPRSRRSTGPWPGTWSSATWPPSTRRPSRWGSSAPSAPPPRRSCVSGRVDRLDARRGPAGDTELAVVDYKTGRRALTTDDARTSLALALYALAAARIFHKPCRRVELHHLPSGEIHAWEHTEATLSRHVRRAEAIAAECRQADERFRAGLAASTADGPGRPGLGRWRTSGRVGRREAAYMDTGRRMSRRGLGPGAGGATSARCARRGPPPGPRTGPGTGWRTGLGDSAPKRIRCAPGHGGAAGAGRWCGWPVHAPLSACLP